MVTHVPQLEWCERNPSGQPVAINTRSAAKGGLAPQVRRVKMGVKQLGYLIFACPAPVVGVMATLFDQALGAVVSFEGDAAVVRLDGRPFRIKFEPGGNNRMAAMGWEVETLAALETLSAKVTASGYAVNPATQDQLDNRGAIAMVRFIDRDGFCFELYVDRPFAEDAETKARFVCGEETNGIFGLGHLVKICGDREASQAFYTDILGFGVSDRITWPAADLFFLHCNQRHHSVALSAQAFGMAGGALHHLMIETKDKAAVEKAYTAIQAMGFPVIMTIGQHTNDMVTSFYMGVPAGFALEFGWGGAVIEDPANWPVGFYDAPSLWGHELRMPPLQ